MGMDEHSDSLDIRNQYLTIKEVAQALNLTYKTAHRHVASGEIKSVHKGDVFLIPREEIAKFKPGFAGRPRTTVPQWRISPAENELIATSIEAELWAGLESADLLRELATLKQSKEYLFPGTVARYIMSDKRKPRHVQFFFVWRESVMPTEHEVTAALGQLRDFLSHVLDWQTVEYETKVIWMHT